MKTIRSLFSSVRRKPWRWGVVLAVGLVYLLPILTVPGLSAVFIKMGDIEGESTDESHKGWIDVQSVSWGVSRAITSGATGGGRDVSAPKATELAVSKYIDKSSPILMFESAAGQSIPEVTLHFTRAGQAGERETYYTITLSDVLVSSYVSSSGSSADSIPIDSISLNFSKMRVAYTPQNPDGSPGQTVEAGYDFEAGKAQ